MEEPLKLKDLIAFFATHRAIKKELFLIRDCGMKNRYQAQRLLKNAPVLWETFNSRIEKGMIKYGYKYKYE